MNAIETVTNEERSRPGTAPAPRALTQQELSRLLREQQFGAVASVRRSGHPHLSTVLYHCDPKQRVLRISTTADRRKVRQLRRDPHAALHVNGANVWSFARGHSPRATSCRDPVRHRPAHQGADRRPGRQRPYACQGLLDVAARAAGGEVVRLLLEAYQRTSSHGRRTRADRVGRSYRITLFCRVCNVMIGAPIAATASCLRGWRRSRAGVEPVCVEARFVGGELHQPTATLSSPLDRPRHELRTEPLPAAV
jgi:hypothetical protein